MDIRKKLIHLLGGYTSEEMAEENGKVHNRAKFNTYACLMEEASRLYGEAADQWCKKIYEYIQRGYNFYKDASR